MMMLEASGIRTLMNKYKISEEDIVIIREEKGKLSILLAQISERT